MHEVLHIIGLCPDSFSHTNLIEVVVTNYQAVIHLLNTNIKGYVTKRTTSRSTLAD
jgi:hypothetical protein